MLPNLKQECTHNIILNVIQNHYLTTIMSPCKYELNDFAC